VNVLVGRDAEIAALDDALAKLRDGRGGAVVLTGDAGLGKTTLLHRLAAEARRHGQLVVRGRAWDGGGAPAYAEWSQVLRDLVDGDPAALDAVGSDSGRAVVEALLHGGAAGPAHESADRYVLFSAVSQVLRRAARDGLVVVLDDLHAAGAPSLALLQHVAREVGDVALLLVVASRTVEARLRPEVDAALAELRTSASCLDLRPLHADACRTLVRSVPGADDDVASRVHAATGGNPFWALELARLLTSGTGAGTPLVPSGVRAVVRGRLALLPPGTDQVLAAGTVLGPEFDVRRLADVVGRDVEDVTALLDAATRAGLVLPTSEAGTRCAFPHAILRETLDADLDAATRRTLHLAAARSLGDIPPPDLLSTRAHHLLAAGVLSPWQDTVAALCASGDRSVEVLAADAAVADYAAALELLPPDADPALGLDVLLRLGLAHLQSGEHGVAKEWFRRGFALARARDDVEGMVRSLLAAGRLVNDMFVTDQWLVDALRVVLARELPLDIRVRLTARLAGELRPGPERTATAAEAERLAVGVADPMTRWEVLRTLGEVTLPDPALERRASWADEMVPLSERLGILQRASAYGTLGVARLWAGDVASAEEALRMRAEYCARTGEPYALAGTAMHEAALHLLAGRWDDAVGPLARALDQGWERARRVSSLAAWMVAEWTRLEAVGPEDALRAHIELCVALSPPEVPNFRLVPPLIAASAGEGLEPLRDELERHIAVRFATVPRNGSWPYVVAAMAEGAWWLRHRDAGAVCRELLAPHAGTLMICAQSSGLGLAVGPADRYLALASAAAGDLGEALALLDRAARDARAWGATPALARTLADRAAVRVERGLDGDVEAAARDHAEALATARRTGMTRFVALLERWGLGTPGHPVPVDGGGSSSEVALLRREGPTWALEHAGRVRHLRDARGLHHLAALLRRPGCEVSATELAGAAVVEADLGPLVDQTALRAYRERVRLLELELDGADACGDAARSQRARAELDELAHHLGAVTGLGGRPRRAGGADERARSAVTKAVRDGIRRIAEVEPALGAHLEATVRTGGSCVHRPELGPHLRWEVDAREFV
jgi:tetratricopeptide (TPR) repeat protein